jgi:hypothetical protein
MVISLFYAVIAMGVLIPAWEVMTGVSWRAAYEDVYGNHDAVPWVWAAGLISGQVLLLLRVDRSWRKLRPRTHVALTAAAMGGATALLVCGIVMAPLAVMYGDGDWPANLDELLFSNLTAVWLGLWAVWGVVFFIYYRRSPARIASAIRWLVTGSILELLVAVPAHVIVRRRHECSAPAATGFGIITGTAIMLMCFGPSVIALYQERRKRYRAAMPPARAHV